MKRQVARQAATWIPSDQEVEPNHVGTYGGIVIDQHKYIPALATQISAYDFDGVRLFSYVESDKWRSGDQAVGGADMGPQ